MTKHHSVDAEIAQMRRETEKLRRETAADIAKIERAAKIEAIQRKREVDDEIAQMRRETEAIKKESEAVSKAIKEELKGYINRGAKILEDQFYAALREKKQIGPIRLDDVRVRVQNIHEYDLLGINGDAVVVGEVKRHMTAQKVTEFVAKLRHHFADDFPQFVRPKVYGMVAGESFTAAAQRVARQHGLFVVSLKNQGLRVENDQAQPLTLVHH